MADAIDIFQGDLPLISDTIRNPDGSVKDLTGAAVRFRMRPAHAATLTVDQPATIISAAAGTVQYQTAAPDTAGLGQYAAWWLVTIGGLPVSTEEFNVDINAHAPLDFTFSGPQAGPCGGAWVTASEVDSFCSGGQSAEGGPDYFFAALMATQALYELSGRQFSGACSSTVRPCAMDCGCWGGLVGNLAISGALQLGVPINWVWGSGFWDCGGNTCGCGVMSEVLLEPYPVTSITQVKINGVVQNPSTYRLDQFRKVVCTNSQMWPACQDLTRDDSQPGTWSISYTHGMEPPVLGKQAACQLACQLLIANSDECQLPESVRRIVRQGITIDKGSIAALMKPMAEGGGTGLPLVDLFLSTYNPLGFRRRPAVWSPDSPRYPRRVN
jgi:hypothetical protein